jgi:phosphonate transport system substrate-binding protein
VALAARWIEQGSRQQEEERILNRFGLTSDAPSQLDERFTDADGDLVADAPSAAAQTIAPEALVFSYVAGPDAVEELAAWKEFTEFLATRTGARVETIAFATLSDQLAALAQGRLHVTGFNTGAVPAAVAGYGFVPVCTFGQADGSFGSPMRFIVPAASPVESIEDLQGRSVAFTSRDSNSGCKAALVLLRDYQMLPQRDYNWRFSGGHLESIQGVASGLYQAAPVSEDLLLTSIANGTIDGDKIRTVYTSERFPPATLGYVYNLPPELGGKIREAFLEFAWPETGLARQFGSSGAVKFVPVSYKQDFALIRRIDDSFRK